MIGRWLSARLARAALFLALSACTLGVGSTAATPAARDRALRAAPLWPAAIAATFARVRPGDAASDASGLAAVPSAAARRAVAEASFVDPTGDSGTAPDIGRVTVSNTANGQITIRVAVTNAPTLATGAQVSVYLDTDQNKATGFRGHDYLLGVASGGGGVYHWNGTKWTLIHPKTASVSYASGATFSINRSDLGASVVTGFNLLALAIQNDRSDAHDFAPDSGTWHYTLAGSSPPATPPSVKPPAPPSTVTRTISSEKPWTNTGVLVSAGTTVTITATGTIDVGLAGHRPIPPAGDHSCRGSVNNTIVPGVACWALVGRIGEEGKPFYVGPKRTIRPQEGGTLYLGVNDDVGYFFDNSGSWQATITFGPATCAPPRTSAVTPASLPSPLHKRLASEPWAKNPIVIAALKKSKATFQSSHGVTGDYAFDDYSVIIDCMPPGLSPETFLLEMGEDLNGTLNNKALNKETAFNRRSKGPLKVGDIYDLDLWGPDNGSIVLVELRRDHFIVQTITTDQMGSHPVSGARQFGFERLDGGAIRFYTRGADKPTIPGTRAICKWGQNAIWNAWIRAIGQEITRRGGKQRSNSFVAKRVDEPYTP